MEDPDINGALVQPVEVIEELPQPRGLNGSNTLYWHKSTRKSIHCHRFGIKWEVFMIASHDDAEPKMVREALSCPTKEEWNKVMEEEMESMKANHV